MTPIPKLRRLAIILGLSFGGWSLLLGGAYGLAWAAAHLF